MNNQDAFERILASLYDARIDDTRWPATSALIRAGWWATRYWPLARSLSVGRWCSAACPLSAADEYLRDKGFEPQ